MSLQCIMMPNSHYNDPCTHFLDYTFILTRVHICL